MFITAGNSLREFDDALNDRVYISWKEAAGPEVGFSQLIYASIGASLRDVFWIGDWRILLSLISFESEVLGVKICSHIVGKPMNSCSKNLCCDVVVEKLTELGRQRGLSPDTPSIMSR